MDIVAAMHWLRHLEHFRVRTNILRLALPWLIQHPLQQQLNASIHGPGLLLLLLLLLLLPY